MKYFSKEKVRSHHVFPLEAKEGDLIGAERQGFPKMVLVGIWKDFFGRDKRFEFREVKTMTSGGSYYQIYSSHNLGVLIRKIMDDGGKVYLFDDLKEFADWALEP